MKNTHFLHPKFIPTWIVIILLRLIVFIPFKIQLVISKIFSYLLMALAYKKYRIAKINIQKCFPHLSIREQRHILHTHFADFFMSMFEMALCFYASKRRLQKLYTLENIKILEEAVADKKNIIILVGHFTTMVIAGRILADNIAFADIYRPQDNALFNHIMVQNFTRHGAQMISARDPKAIVAALKNGVPIWYAPDQDLGKKNSVFAPFFGIQTNTITATAKLAKSANAEVIAFGFYRHKNGYHCSFARIENYPSGDDVMDATQINAELERYIMHTPSQYLWTHRRFKTRPEGEKSFY